MTHALLIAVTVEILYFFTTFSCLRGYWQEGLTGNGFDRPMERRKWAFTAVKSLLRQYWKNFKYSETEIEMCRLVQVLWKWFVFWDCFCPEIFCSHRYFCA